MRAVRGDRVGVAVDVAQRQVGERVRRGAGVAPDRGPEDERDACPARAEVRGGQRDAPREAGDDGAEAARRGEPADAALGRPDDRERRVGGRDRATVAHAPADEREDDVLGLVQRRERARAEHGRVVGDEEDGARVVAHVSAASYAATVALAAALPRERGLDRRARGVAELAAPRGLVEQRAQLARQRLRIAGSDEPHAAPGRGDLLRARLAAAADRGHCAGHRLDVGDAERLVDARQHEHARGPGGGARLGRRS